MYTPVRESRLHASPNGSAGQSSSHSEESFEDVSAKLPLIPSVKQNISTASSTFNHASATRYARCIFTLLATVRFDTLLRATTRPCGARYALSQHATVHAVLCRTAAVGVGARRCQDRTFEEESQVAT